MRKNWRVGPSARQSAGRAQKRNPFYHVGPARPGPFNTGQKQAWPKRAGPARFDTPMFGQLVSFGNLVPPFPIDVAAIFFFLQSSSSYNPII